MEVYTFRCCKQKDGQSLDEFVTELRKLSKNCEFNDVDREILSQVIQNCKSKQLRRRALRESDKGLQDILDLGRAMEISDTQAQAMERESTASVNKDTTSHRLEGTILNHEEDRDSENSTVRNKLQLVGIVGDHFRIEITIVQQKTRHVMLVRILDISRKCAGARIYINLQLCR